MVNSKKYFAGDHNAGLHSKVVQAIIRVNQGMASSYREDEETIRMQDNIDALFGKKTKALTFTTGTAANIVALTSLTKSYNSIVCAKSGHIATYEAGGPTRFSGCSLDSLPTKNGKITIEQIDQLLVKRAGSTDFIQPKVVYITQPTEMGTLWALEELKELSNYCQKKNLYLFMDGARLANAIAKLDVDIRKMTTDIGIDVVSWGGIKNGGLADVLVYLNTDLASDVGFIYKQIGQDVAKSRFYAASANALLENGLWIQNANHANNMTERLYSKIKNSQNIRIIVPVETNFIWSIMPPKKIDKLSKDFVFYLETNDLEIEEYEQYPFFSRFLTSWATTEEEVDLFSEAINS